MPEAAARNPVKARAANNGVPFASLEELALHAGLMRRAIEALAVADAFAGLGRREASWASHAVDPGLTSDLPLFGRAVKADHPEERPLIAEAEASLPPMKEGEDIALMRQQPITAKGVIFVTIEDEHGHANVVPGLARTGQGLPLPSLDLRQHDRHRRLAHPPSPRSFNKTAETSRSGH